VVPGVEHRFVEAGGLRMHVAEAGSGEPIVLLHGWPQNWYAWRHLIPPLAERYRVICPDLRGFGWSEAPPRGYDKETLAQDVVNLMDALGLERVRLVGHDWGGWAGFLICLFHPQRVERYLALNIAHPWNGFSLRAALNLWRFSYQWVLATPLLGPAVARRLPRHRKLLSARLGVAWTSEEFEGLFGQFREPARALATSQLYREFVVRETPKAVAGRYRRWRLSTPTLMLFGTDDPAIGVHLTQGYEPYADDMRVKYVQGCGHFIADERPELVAERALEFFAP
jgi:pimeloyl-ACP methyl ester carboxylesterase